jgi:hypothetical protein
MDSTARRHLELYASLVRYRRLQRLRLRKATTNYLINLCDPEWNYFRSVHLSSRIEAIDRLVGLRKSLPKICGRGASRQL